MSGFTRGSVVAGLVLLLLATTSCQSVTIPLGPGEPEKPLAQKQGGWMPVVVDLKANDRYISYPAKLIGGVELGTKKYTFPLQVIFEQTFNAEAGSTILAPGSAGDGALSLKIKVTGARLETPSSGNIGNFLLAVDVECRDSGGSILDSFGATSSRVSNLDGRTTPKGVWSACLEVSRKILARLQKSGRVQTAARKALKGAPTPARGPGPKPVPPVSAERPLLTPRGVSWGEGVEAVTAGRFAIVITADRYQSDPGWNLPSSKKSGEVITAALSRNARISPKHIRWLKGSEVNRSAVKAAIDNIGKRLRSDDNLLVVYYAGHGWVDSKGDPYFFTHYTSESVGGGFEGVLRRSDLVQWTSALEQRARGAGGDLETVLIVDACRVGTAAPPPTARLETSGVWEVYGTKEGRYAAVGSDETEPFPFTQSLADSMRSLGERKERADLMRLFNEAHRQTLKLTKNKQEPELKRPETGGTPVLVMPFRITFTVKLLDALNGVGITEKATVRYGGGEYPVKDGRVVLETSGGSHRLEVEAVGHLARSESLTVKDEHQGASVEVPLYPSAVIVRGNVAPPQDVRVSVSGVEPGASREGYHRLGTQTDPLGGFELLLPTLGEGLELVFTAGGQTVHREPLKARPTSSTRVGVLLVPTLELTIPLGSR